MYYGSFEDSDFLKFLSWRYSDKKQENENEYQISIPTISELNKKYHPEWNDEINQLTAENSVISYAISEIFWHLVRWEQRSTQYSFLNYHFEKYSGEKADFIDFIESVIRYHNPGCKDFTGMPEQRILDWIKNKKQELETSTVPDQSKKKTYVTHPQQVLLFHELGIIKYLKDKFNLGHEQTAEIIALLSNQGKDNAGDYIRSLDLPKERTAKSKRNLYAQTPENIEFVNRIMNKIIPPV